MKKYLLLLFLIFSIVSFADDDEIDYSQIPQNIMNSITANAEERYPTDYNMQNYIIDQQARAYLKNRRIKGNKTTSNSNIEKRIDDNFIEYKGLQFYSFESDSDYNNWILSKDIDFSLSLIKSKTKPACGYFFDYKNDLIDLEKIDAFVFDIDGETFKVDASKKIEKDNNIIYAASGYAFNYPLFKALTTANKISIYLYNENNSLYSFQVSENSISKINIFSEFCIKKMNM